ncbi:hypothetical protein ACUYOF_23370 [Photobacterium ganghwense]|uniref:hypothetical protein n=1 Tax=Photobacterium ganghwense TaxID=320778 RepID=UPI0040574F86
MNSEACDLAIGPALLNIKKGHQLIFSHQDLSAQFSYRSHESGRGQTRWYWP